MRSKRTLFLIEVAIFATFAYLLDIIPFLSFKIWAQGGSVSLAMIPIFIIAFRWGLKGGVLSGLIWGVLQVAIGPASIYTPLQGFIEYGLAFTVLGFAGVFAKPVQLAIKDGRAKASSLFIMLGVLLGSALRFIAHYTAGVVFFAEYTPEGQSVWIYSLVYNLSYMLPSLIICTIVVSFLFNKQPRTLLSAA